MRAQRSVQVRLSKRLLTPWTPNSRRQRACRSQVVPILRAGLVPLEMANTVLPAMNTYHVGLIRDDVTLQARPMK